MRKKPCSDSQITSAKKFRSSWTPQNEEIKLQPWNNHSIWRWELVIHVHRTALSMISKNTLILIISKLKLSRPSTTKLQKIIACPLHAVGKLRAVTHVQKSRLKSSKNRRLKVSTETAAVYNSQVCDPIRLLSAAKRWTLTAQWITDGFTTPKR